MGSKSETATLPTLKPRKTSRISFQIEQWSKALPELLPLFDDLWDEVAVDKDRFKAECDQEKYGELEKVGYLHLVTARSEGELAGYFLVILTPNGHYKGAGLFAFTDMYYLKPEFRAGTTGIRLFSFVELTLREKNVVKIYTSHKLHKDRSALMDFMGYKPVDMIYSKVIG